MKDGVGAIARYDFVPMIYCEGCNQQHGGEGAINAFTPVQEELTRNEHKCQWCYASVCRGVINSDSCGAANADGSAAAITRVGDICISPLSINWCAALSADTL